MSIIAKEDQIRIAAYIRVSTTAADQENSYETQERYFNQLLSQNSKWISAGIYFDYGISGTSEQGRTGYQRLLRHCREGRINRIVCKSISRFARNTRDFMTALDILRDNRVSIYFEKENLDTDNPVNSFVLTALGAIAQEESRSISENIRWGFQKRYPIGETHNIEIYGYRYSKGENAYLTTKSGYRLRQIEIVEKEARVVRRIFTEVSEGIPYAEVAKRLNCEGIPAPQSCFTKKHKRIREGRPAEKGELKDHIEQGWTADQISRMIRLERYTGDVLLQKTYTSSYLTHKVQKNRGEAARYQVYDHHPAIISRELFEQVQEIRKWNAALFGSCNHGCRRSYPLSGRLICARCGRFYHTRNRKYNPVWFCPSAELNNGKNVCQAQRIYEEQIIRMIRKAVLERFDLLTAVSGDGYVFHDHAEHFVVKMRQRLENIRETDHIERDRNFLKRKIMTLQAEGLAEKEAEKRETLKKEEQKLARQLADLENYWNELEDSYESREQTIEWLKTLPSGMEGMTAFLNGLTDAHVGAFVLSVTVYSPLRYKVHWFDDTYTDVVMLSNIEDHRFNQPSIEVIGEEE